MLSILQFIQQNISTLMPFQFLLNYINFFPRVPRKSLYLSYIFLYLAISIYYPSIFYLSISLYIYIYIVKFSYRSTLEHPKKRPTSLAHFWLEALCNTLLARSFLQGKEAKHLKHTFGSKLSPRKSG